MNKTPHGSHWLLVGVHPEGTCEAFPIGIFSGWWRDSELESGMGPLRPSRTIPISIWMCPQFLQVSVFLPLKWPDDIS